MEQYSKAFNFNIKHNNMLTLEQLSKLPTPRLLKYFKKYRVFTPEWKEPEWTDYDNYILAIKDMLNTREHVEEN